jgi:hypothetical protein
VWIELIIVYSAIVIAWCFLAAAIAETLQRYEKSRSILVATHKSELHKLSRRDDPWQQRGRHR